MVQQTIVMLTTAFEVYTRTRFVELEKESKTVNMKHCIIPKSTGRSSKKK